MRDLDFLSRFVLSVERFPNNTAFVFGEQTVTYRDFGCAVEAVRIALAQETSTEDQCIAVFATHELMTYAALVAAMSLGLAYVPINPRAPIQRNATILKQSGARLLLCAAKGAEADQVVQSAACEASLFETHRLELTHPLSAFDRPDPAKIAYLLFTSGSTGIPKGVPVSHGNLSAFIHAVIDETDWEFSATDRFLQMFDLTFDLSIMCYAVPLSVGGSCHVVPEGKGGFVGVSQTLRRGSVTVALMVPSVLTFLERYFDELHLPDIRLSLFCGEALQERLAKNWRRCIPNARLINVYGPTEATIFCSAYEYADADENSSYLGVVSIGSELRGTSFRVVDENLSSVSDGQIGELILLGPQVAPGYWRNPEKTHQAFITLEGGAVGYRTGDLAFSRANRFFYCGRADSQVKIDGYRVELGEIECHARSFAGIRDAVVVPQQSDGRVVALHLFALGDETPANLERFKQGYREFLAAILPPYMVPQKVHYRSEFPLNSNGKVDRRQLMEGEST